MGESTLTPTTSETDGSTVARLDARTRLREAAIDLLSTKWFSVVSVADICRKAGLSNGLFYRYFRNKEELFTSLLKEFLQIVSEAVAGIPDGRLSEMVRGFVDVILSVTRRHRRLFSIFREGQYRHFAFEERLRTIYAEFGRRMLGRSIGIAELTYLLSGVRFVAYRSVYGHIEADPDTLVEVILHGVFVEPIRGGGERIFNIEVVPLPIRLNETSRDRLLRSGRRLFGTNGFHDVGIHQVTAEAALSVGTFYTYFESKEAFYEEIIRQASHDVRSFINRNLTGDLRRIEYEVQGMYLFAFLLTLERSVYNLVREAEFVLPDAVRRYYDAFQNGYERNLTGTRAGDRVTIINILLGLSHYFGMELLLDQSMERATALLRELAALLHSGLCGPDK